MKSISHKKERSSGINPAHVETLPITLIMEMCNGKSVKEFFKLKLCIYTTSSMSDLYKFKMSLFVHGKPEVFMLFICNFNMTLAATVTLEIDVNIQYLRVLVHG